MKIRLNLGIGFHYDCTKPNWMYSFVETERAVFFLRVGGSHPCSNLLFLICACSSAKFRSLLAVYFYLFYRRSLLAQYVEKPHKADRFGLQHGSNSNRITSSVYYSGLSCRLVVSTTLYPYILLAVHLNTLDVKKDCSLLHKAVRFEIDGQ